MVAGDVAGLLARFAELKRKARERTGTGYPIIVIQEAGLDGFWIHRVLQKEGIESHVVDAASIAAPRRRRRAKTDKIDGEALLRALLAYKRGEPRVCSMVVAPSPEDAPAASQALLGERVHTNRTGIAVLAGIPPRRCGVGERAEALRTGDGWPLPACLKAQIGRELDRLELLLDQIRAVEVEQDALLTQESVTQSKAGGEAKLPNALAQLLAVKGVGAHAAAVLWTEGLCRQFSNRRQVAAYAGLAATPWRSGAVAHEQGLSKAGNPRLRTMMVQLAWLWLRHQPQSALAQWFHARSRQDRKGSIVALARKLLVALWKYATQGVLIEGAVMKQAV